MLQFSHCIVMFILGPTNHALTSWCTNLLQEKISWILQSQPTIGLEMNQPSWPMIATCSPQALWIFPGENKGEGDNKTKTASCVASGGDRKCVSHWLRTERHRRREEPATQVQWECLAEYHFWIIWMMSAESPCCYDTHKKLDNLRARLRSW